jgi:hypothetical protein
MKTLSVRQPYAEWIASGKKKIEYRGWRTPHEPGEDLLIVASSNRNAEDIPDRVLADKAELERVYPRSVAICVVSLVRIEGERYDYQWILRNPRRVQPFHVKGKIFTFDTHDRLIRFVQ